VSNFDQISPSGRYRLRSASVEVGHKASRAMSKSDEFRHYAEEAMGWARNRTSPKEKVVLINLARIWMQAAERSENPVVVKELAPK